MKPWMFVCFGFVLFALTYVAAASAQSMDFKRDGVRGTPVIPVTSSSAGTQLCDYIDNECSVQVAEDAVVKVCVAPVNFGTTCAAGLTAAQGRCYGPMEGWSYSPREDGWIGQLCGILASGSTAVNVKVIRR